MSILGTDLLSLQFSVVAPSSHSSVLGRKICSSNLSCSGGKRWDVVRLFVRSYEGAIHFIVLVKFRHHLPTSSVSSSFRDHLQRRPCFYPLIVLFAVVAVPSPSKRSICGGIHLTRSAGYEHKGAWTLVRTISTTEFTGPIRSSI